MTVMLTRNLQINHAELAVGISPLNPNITSLVPSVHPTSVNPTSLQILDGLVNQQALMISYLDDFKLMMIITLRALPLAWVLKKPDTAPVQMQMAHD